MAAPVGGAGGAGAGGSVRSLTTADFDEVLFGTTGQVKTITLNRPKALNALSLPMVRAIRPQIDAWCAEHGDSTTGTAVVMKGTGEKAFCAGGDVRAIAEDGKAGGSLPADFFREEYELDYRLATMGVPHIAFMDGITMGGGVGLTVHGSFRIATERTMFAMPETAIGFFPDVGGAHFLPRLDGELGTFLALSGHRLKGADCLFAGIATHYIQSDDLPAVEAALAELSEFDDAAIASVLEPFSADPGETNLFEMRTVIDRCFAHDSVADILAALDDDGSEVAAKAAKTMRRMSPTAMSVTLEQLRRGAKLDLAECLKMEYRISQVMMARDDFYEGIRAVLVDRDHAPKWGPEEEVAPYFDALDADKELTVPARVRDPATNTGLAGQAAVEAALASGIAADADTILAELAKNGSVLSSTQPGQKTKVQGILSLVE